MLLIFIYVVYENISVGGWGADLGIKTSKLAVCKYFVLCIFKRKRIKNLTNGLWEGIFRDLAKI